MAEIFNVDESFDRNRFDGACCAFGVFDVSIRDTKRFSRAR